MNHVYNHNYNHNLLPRRAAVAALAASLVANLAVLGGLAALVESVASPPWLPPEQAGLVAHCDAERASPRRRACLKEAVARRDAKRVADAR
jgi:hypothetical protein